MGIIRFRNDPTGITGSEEVKFSGSITSYLMQKSVNVDHITVYLNGEEVTLPSTGIIDDRLFRPLSEFDEALIISAPKGFEVLIYAAVAAVAAVAATALLAPSVNPNNSGQVQDSPNNTLNAQTNRARPYQAIPDIYGEPIPYPDLSGEATQEYVEQPVGQAQKVITQLMPVCIQTYEVDEVYTSDTLISDLGGSYSVYQPNNGSCIIPTVRETFSINEIDGQELFAPNQSESIYNKTINTDEDTSSVVDNGDGTCTFITEISLSDFPQEFPAVGSIKFTYKDDPSDPDTKTADFNFVTYTGLTLGSSSSLTFETASPLSLSYVYRAEIKANKNTEIGPFSTPVDGDQLWIDFVFPRGLKDTVDVTVEYTVDNGTTSQSLSVDYSFTKDTLDSQYFTRKIVSPIGKCKWSPSFIRTSTLSDDPGKPSQVKLERVASIVTQTNKNYGDVTIVEVTIPATLQATSLRENKVNLRGGRKVISYNRATKQIDYTLRRSRSGADAILHEFVMVFGLDPSMLDIDKLYSIYDGLSDPRLGYFDWTFDDINVSLGSRINTIANAARIYLIPSGDTYTFNRDELQAFPKTILGRRDMASGGEYRYTYQPQMQSDKDSVRVDYVDPETNKKAFIERKVVNGQFVEGVGVNPVKVELPCCKEEFNAINRAELEIRKLYYLRETIVDTFLAGNASIVEQGDLIRYEEVYNENILGGEIVGVNGNTLTLSEQVPDGDLFIEWQTATGGISQRYAATKAGVKAVSVPVTTGIFTAGTLNAKGSSYVLSTSSVLDSLEYVIGSPPKPSNDGRTVKLSLTKYDARVYEFDS